MVEKRKTKNGIRSLKRGCKANRVGRARFPLMENELFIMFTNMRDEGKRVKRWWFNTKAKQLVTEIYTDEIGSFKLSDRWLSAFCKRKSISFRRKTHASQKAHNQLRNSIANFHAE